MPFGGTVTEKEKNRLANVAPERMEIENACQAVFTDHLPFVWYVSLLAVVAMGVDLDLARLDAVAEWDEYGSKGRGEEFWFTAETLPCAFVRPTFCGR